MWQRGYVATGIRRNGDARQPDTVLFGTVDARRPWSMWAPTSGTTRSLRLPWATLQSQSRSVPPAAVGAQASLGPRTHCLPFAPLPRGTPTLPWLLPVPCTRSRCVCVPTRSHQCCNRAASVVQPCCNRSSAGSLLHSHLRRSGSIAVRTREESLGPWQPIRASSARIEHAAAQASPLLPLGSTSAHQYP
jgi:hypothetical protein